MMRWKRDVTIKFTVDVWLSMEMHGKRHMVNLWSSIELLLVTMRGCQQSKYIYGKHSSAGLQSHLLQQLLQRLFLHLPASHICCS
jgi:hypothetical protein